MREKTRGWDWPHIFPRKLILAAWLAFHLILGIGIAVQVWQAPEGPLWLNVWKAIGGNSGGAWYWFVSWVYLSSEVMTMILTLLSNKARVEQAAAEAASKAAAKQYRLWSDWNRRREEAEAEGLAFDEPPPDAPAGLHRNGNE
jgi:hypothetical protein